MPICYYCSSHSLFNYNESVIVTLLHLAGINFHIRYSKSVLTQNKSSFSLPELMTNYNVYPDMSKRSPHGAMINNNIRELLHALETEAAMEAAEAAEVGGGEIDGVEGKYMYNNLIYRVTCNCDFCFTYYLISVNNMDTSNHFRCQICYTYVQCFQVSYHYMIVSPKDLSKHTFVCVYTCLLYTSDAADE